MNRNVLYDSAERFFEDRGSGTMKLTAAAATSACAKAAENGLVVARVEGGIWHSPGFEARVDCIWDGADPPLSSEEAHRNNLLAAAFIESEKNRHSAFILTAPPVGGLAPQAI